MIDAKRTMLDRVLVVDDDHMVREVLVEMARELSAEVQAVASGQQACDVLDGEFFELLITDIRMPGVDGLEVVRYARRRCPSTRVVVVTGFAGPHEERAVRQLEAVILRKPFGADAFRQAVRRALERS
jgi:CheY-like chemotaxis protein